jgi:hypothetical protein
MHQNEINFHGLALLPVLYFMIFGVNYIKNFFVKFGLTKDEYTEIAHHIREIYLILNNDLNLNSVSDQDEGEIIYRLLKCEKYIESANISNKGIFNFKFKKVLIINLKFREKNVIK